jgi:hypothetical protein
MASTETAATNCRIVKRTMETGHRDWLMTFRRTPGAIR